MKKANVLKFAVLSLGPNPLITKPPSQPLKQAGNINLLTMNVTNSPFCDTLHNICNGTFQICSEYAFINSRLSYPSKLSVLNTYVGATILINTFWKHGLQSMCSQTTKHLLYISYTRNCITNALSRTNEDSKLNRSHGLCDHFLMHTSQESEVFPNHGILHDWHQFKGPKGTISLCQLE